MYNITNGIIKKLLQENNYTQTKFARKLNVTQASVSRYLSGQMQIDIVTLNKIADIFNVSTDYLLGRSLLKSNDVSEASKYIEENNLISLIGLDDDDIEIIKLMIEQLKRK